MSFKRLNPEDFVVSSDSITAGLWSGGEVELSTFFTSSTQELSSAGKYYLNIFQTASTEASAEIQFAITYGNLNGSGSELYDANVDGKSYSSTIWGQYRNLVLGDENANFSFGGSTGTDFWAISIDRNRYKEKLFPGSLTLSLSGSAGIMSITDNSQVVNSIEFTDAGRVFQLVSGSAGTVYTGSGTDGVYGYSPSSGSYGLFLPDIATLVLNPIALSASIELTTTTGSNSNDNNNRTLFEAISSSVADGGNAFRLNSQETISSDYIAIQPRFSEFNYSENPSFISGSTGEVIYNEFINNPTTYITTIGLYNDNNELLAVAKMSRPLRKDFTKNASVRVKLDF